MRAKRLFAANTHTYYPVIIPRRGDNAVIARTAAPAEQREIIHLCGNFETRPGARSYPRTGGQKGFRFSCTYGGRERGEGEEGERGVSTAIRFALSSLSTDPLEAENDPR